MAAFMEEIKHLKIDLHDIESATNNFDKTKIIGSGGYGKVYRGELCHYKGRSMVAIKRLDRILGQGEPEFLKEIMVLSRYNHENIIALVGFCTEGGEKILVYEYASHGSLDRHISGTALSWRQRLNICLAIAKGINYLHDPKGTHQRVLHCDIKSSNVLLDENWIAKVSDFGLSKIGPANQEHTFLISNVVGTLGYLDPLYMDTYTLTKESDVYSFGVVLFELLCGRLCYENKNGRFHVLVPMWRKRFLDRKLDEILFQDWKQRIDLSYLKPFIDIASQCVHQSREERPTMANVVERLEIALRSWVEAESLRCLSGRCCELLPSPRSTIAIAFSVDGKILASTHGDHTIKITDYQTGKCEKVLTGHQRTPWVVRFHPLHPEILASGSLDHEVRLWNVNTAECIGSREFGRPIASIAFHTEGELLAVATGHKVYLWHYNSTEDTSSPAMVLRTKRSLRAVHFHPHSGQFLLTASLLDLDSSDSTMEPATSLGQFHYPPPSVYMENLNSMNRLCLASELPLMPIPVFHSPLNPNTNSMPQLQVDSQLDNTVNGPRESSVRLQVLANATELYEQMTNTCDVRQYMCMCWELPFMERWLVSKIQAGTSLTTLPDESDISNRKVLEGSFVMPEQPGADILSPNSDSTSASQYKQKAIISGIKSQLSAVLTVNAVAELPSIAELNIHDFKNPSASVTGKNCRLTISSAVVTSEKGAHFSPCGRYLAACVACVHPQLQADPGIPTKFEAHLVMYELRVYSLEEATFGSVLISRPIRAAHCITSIQFSPTSEHILVAYGRPHSYLLNSILISVETSLSIYTMLEIYRVSDMELVSVLPSENVEINVACFHPVAGGGLAYGTNGGKLRILKYDCDFAAHMTRLDHFFEAQRVDVDL